VKTVSLVRAGRWLFAAVVAIFLVSQDAAFSAQSGVKRPDRTFMWSVQGPKSRAYVLGSLHVLRKGVYPLDARIEKAYQACPRVLLEADPSGVSEEDLRQTMIRLGTYQDGSTLKGVVSPETYARLGDRVEANKVGMERFEKFRPWFAAFSIAALELKRLGFASEIGIDAHFYRKARADGREMHYLENARQQLELLAGSSPGREEDILKQALEELDVVEQHSGEMMRAWKEGDAGRMELLLKKSLKGFPDIEKRLFTDRNMAWAGAVDRLLSQDRDVFIVVGAAHLVGRTGLLELLKKRKFIVVQQ
jgi:hypothetical protein